MLVAKRPERAIGSWSPVTSSALPGSGDTSIERVALAISQDGSKFYVAIVDGNGNLYNSAIFVSDHTAGVWQKLPVNNAQLASDNGEHQWWYDAVIAVDPTKANTAYLGGVDLYQTQDGGVTWSVAPGYTSAVHTDQHALTFLNATSSDFYLGNDGGIWEGYNGPFYTNLNGANGAGLNITQLYGASVGLTGPDAQIYAGAQDNSILQYPLGVNGIAQWNEVATGSTNGDGGQVAVDPTNNAIVYAEQSWGELYRSPDGGSANSWIQIGGDATSSSPGVNGLNACPNNSQGIITSSDCDPTNWVMPIALAPTNHDELFAGTDKVYRSTNEGQNWSPLGSLDQLDGRNPISALAIGPQSDSVLYVGTNNGDVFASTDGGTTWEQSHPPSSAGGIVTSLAVDPINASNVYATIANFATCSGCGEHIFGSTNGGGTWTDLDASGHLPNTPFESVVVDPLNSSTIFVGTDVGIFDTADGGTTWSQVFGLPAVAVEQLFTDSKGTQLYVATHGRGLWRVPLLDGTLYAAQSANDPTPQLGCTPDKDNSLYVYADSSLNGSRQWTFRDTEPPAGVCSQAEALLLAHGTLFFAGDPTSTGQGVDLFALDPLSGRVLWHTTLLAPSGWNGMAYGNGMLYVASDKLSAFNASTGALIWSDQLGKVTKQSPELRVVSLLAANNLIYASDGSGVLYALDPGSGAKVWSTKTTVYTAKAFADGMLYVDHGGDYLDALNGNTGALVWEQQYQVAGTAMAPDALTVANGVIYGGASANFVSNGSDNAMMAINATTGALIWSYYIGKGYEGPVAPQIGADGLVYDSGHDLYAWNATTGALVWSKTFDPLPEPNQVVLSGDVLYTNPNAYAPYALNPLTGATLWTEPTYGATTPYVWPVIATTF